MLHIIGPEGTREQSAAVAIRDLIVQAWPGLVEDPTSNIWLVASAKCHGQRVRDIDVLLLADLSPSYEFRQFLPFTRPDGQLVRPDSIELESLCLVVEVKDHPPEHVRFIGSTVEVLYRDKWHSATEQSEAQLYSVKGYLDAHRIAPPRITPLVWLRQVPNTSLPPRPHNVIGANPTWELLLNVVAQVSPPYSRSRDWVLSASKGSAAMEPVANLFAKTLTPTRLDRARMELISKREARLDDFIQEVGRKLMILRGQGGTGKTVRLLQLGIRLSSEQGARVLILTYNKALVADIRRLLTILGVSDDISDGTVQVQTLHSFLHSVLYGLGIIARDYPTFLEDIERLKEDALAFIRAGVISKTDVSQLVTSNSAAFRWDYIFVDEGQDWPDNERELLTSIYSYSRLVVADGVQQLIRSATPADWRGTLTPNECRVVPLKKCLRMKAGLAHFVTAFAHSLGLLQADWVPNEEAPGGRVLIVDGPYLNDRALHDRLMLDNSQDLNSPVDMLFCLPPQLVEHDTELDERRSIPSKIFQQWGFSTWDGASEGVRETYPTEIGQLRLVQYDSCRGLEGWVVVNLALDLFYEHKLRSYVPSSAATVGPAATHEELAHQQAARWLLIPMSRAIDTLVIQVSRQHSPVRTALEHATRECADYVEWLRPE